MVKNTKTLLSLSLPVIVLILAYLALKNADSLSPSQLKIIPYLPYLVLVTVAVLAYRFNQSRVFYLAAGFIGLQTILPGNIIRQFRFDVAELDLVYLLIAILVPLNIVIFSLLKERGIFSRWGLLKLAFLTGQFLGAAWIISASPPDIVNTISNQFLPWNVQIIPGLAPLGLIIIGLGILIMLLQLRMTRSYFSAVSAGIILCTALLIYWRGLGLAAPLFTAAIGLLMIVFIIQNSYTMAYLDELTEIPGRRALREEMMKLSGNYVLAMADIDFFKSFNDTYGHDVGDEVLRMVAAKLNRVTGGGKAFRYGGEEFTIIFPGKKLNDALPHLEKVRESIAQSQFSLRGKDRPRKKPKTIKPAKQVRKVSVTISIGAAEKTQPWEKAGDIMTAADKALYRAKNAGRNRVSK
ncbi:MAG: diguanylate cyclase [Deltaproteobacteria bacterium]